jgi:hypothetical protein
MSTKPNNMKQQQEQEQKELCQGCVRTSCSFCVNICIFLKKKLRNNSNKLCCEDLTVLCFLLCERICDFTTRT